MGIEINGRTNTIKKVNTEGVYTLNYLIINGTEYEWPSYTPDVPPTPIEPSDPMEWKELTTTFELWAPNQTDSSGVGINTIIKSDTVDGDITSAVWVAHYDVKYNNGNTTYSANVTFKVANSTSVYDVSGNELQAKPLDDKYKTITNFQLWDYQAKPGTSGEWIKPLTFKYQAPVTSTVLATVRLDEVTEEENVVVTQDAVVNNNLAVDGTINGLLWTWETIYLEVSQYNIGFGMFAQFYDSKYTVNGIEYELPFFQLSPGLSYTTDNIIVSWLANGQLLLESTTSEPITNISFAPRILRYE